jgi:hypothetical protein
MLPKLKKEKKDDVFCKLSTMQGNEVRNNCYSFIFEYLLAFQSHGGAAE